MPKSFQRPKFEEIVIPSHLLQDIIDEECVLFLGAGASTEAKGATGRPLYSKELLLDELIRECNCPAELPKLLPEVAQYYCEALDAGNKGRLARLIRERIDRFMKIPPLYREVTVCHSIIASIPHFKVVVSTNWDPFMERTMNVIPIVRDKDIAYWSDASRQVIKMHGCITDPESMIITKSDYQNYIRRMSHSQISNKIRDLMGTKTFLFLGYSLADPSFETIHSNILERLGVFARTSFAILPNVAEHDIANWKKRGVIVIRGLAYPFLKKLGQMLVERKVLFDVYNEMMILDNQLQEIYQVHSDLDQDTDVGFATAMYQDGLQHELESLIYALKTGITKDQVADMLRRSKEKLEYYESSKDKFAPMEVAYWNGRTRCLEWFLSADRKSLLKFFSASRMKPINKDEFDSESSSLPKTNPG